MAASGVNEILPEVHEGDRLSARWLNTLAATAMRNNRFNRGRMRTLSNGAGNFTLPDEEDGLLFYNGDATTIPAYGVVLTDDIQAAGGPDVAPKAKKPDAFGVQENFLINGESTVEGTSWGNAQFGYGNVYLAAYDSADGTPHKGEEWGVMSGTYLLKAGGGGFVVIGIYSSTDHLVLVRSSPMMSFRGMTNANVPSLGVSDVTVWALKGGVLTNLGVTVPSVYNGSSCVVKGSQYVICKFDRSDPSNPWWFDIFQTA